MNHEGMIKCRICHEWFDPRYIILDWLNSGDPVCHGCGNGANTGEDERIEAIAGYFMERIGNLNVTIQDLRNIMGGKDRYIDRIKGVA